MVSNISATSLRNSALNSVTGSPGWESTGSGYLTILRIISLLIAPYLFDVSAEISLHFEERVSAEFLLGQAGDGEGDHGLGSYTGGGNDANIAALITCAGGLAGIEAHRFEGAAEGGDGLQVAAHHNIFTVGYAALNAAGVVLRANEAGGLFGLGGVVNGIVDLGAEGLGGSDTAANLDGFHGLQAHHRPG